MDAMSKITVRLHKELYKKIIDNAQQEKRTKSGLLAKILEKQAGLGEYHLESMKFTAWSELFRVNKNNKEKNHTVYPPIGVSISEKTIFFVERMALLNNDTLQNTVTDLVVRYYFENTE